MYSDLQDLLDTRTYYVQPRELPTQGLLITQSLTPHLAIVVSSITVPDLSTLFVFSSPVCPCQYSAVGSGYVPITPSTRCRWTEICETSNENEIISNTAQSEE